MGNRKSNARTNRCYCHCHCHIATDVSKCWQQQIKRLGHLHWLMWHQCYKKGKLIKHITHERNWGICSCVCNKWHSWRGFAPELPTVPGVTQLQLSNRICSAFLLFPALKMFLSTALIRGFSSVGGWTTALAYTVNLILLIICTLSFPLGETLTCVISAQTGRESTESSNSKCLGRGTLTSMCHTNSHAAR